MTKKQRRCHSYCALLQVASALGVGCLGKPPENGSPNDAAFSTDARGDGPVGLCPPGKQSIESHFVFAAHRNGAVGRLNADALDDFVVHGTAQSKSNPSKTIPYVWVYMGDANGFDLQCPDEEYPLDGIEYIGAVFIDRLFTTAEASSDLIIVGDKLVQPADSVATLIWRHYTGSDSASVAIDHDVSGFGVPDWNDVVARTGFVAALLSEDRAKTETNAQLFWGGGNHVYATELNLLSGVPSIGMDSTHISPPSAARTVAGMVGSSVGGVRELYGVRISTVNESTIFYDNRQNDDPTFLLTLDDAPSSSMGPHQQLDFFRPMSLGNRAAIFSATNLGTEKPSLEVATPTPVGNFKIQSTSDSSIAFRDAFITNFDNLNEAGARTQMKLLVLQQKRYAAGQSSTFLALHELDIVNAADREINPPANYQWVPIMDGDVSDTFPPFMVVGNFEDAAVGKMSVRVFHRTGASASDFGTGVNCYLASLKPGLTGADTLATKTCH
jgi:hypothetical protein